MQMAFKPRAGSFSLAFVIFLALILSACGGGGMGSSGGSGTSGNGGMAGGTGGSSSTPPPTATRASSVTITPASATVNAGENLVLQAAVSGTTDQTVTWSVNGVVGGNATVGTISTHGLYQSPDARPSAALVSIKATSITNSSASGSSSVTIENPIPKIIAVTPDSFQSPASFNLTTSGTGFVRGAVVNWGTIKLPTTFVSSTRLTATGTQATSVRSVVLSVDNPDPGAARSNVFYMVTDPTHVMTKAAAARILQQTSWGPKSETIIQVQLSKDLQTYLNSQYDYPSSNCYPAPAEKDNVTTLEQRFFVCAVMRGDQLRQRVAFALSQIMVISSNKVGNTSALTAWQNLMLRDAFGNYYNLLKDVTLSPMMGNYLDMVNNDKPDPVNGTDPNENYAREVMQLFTIGLDQLNPDGTLKVDGSGNAIPTYTQDTVEGFAHVFTGWTYPSKSGSGHWTNPEYYGGPMVAFDAHHDAGTKQLLNGQVIPAGGTAQADLDAALQNIFNHPNVGPFICKQLIQHLVTSNPSPEYVGRVSAVFDNNGAGVRGDLKAVVSAIILDTEARRGDDAADVQPNDGYLKEPVLLMANIFRAMNTRSNGDGFTDYAINLKEEPMNPPSVFNFYSPSFQIPGTNLLGPEFQLFNSSTTISRANFVNDAVYRGIGQSMSVNLSEYLLLAPSPDQLVDRLGEIMMHGQMSTDMRSTIVNAVSGIQDNTRRVQAALYLIGSSSQFQVEH